MKTEKNILIAFLLNISFSIFELIGGIFTNSVAKRHGITHTTIEFEEEGLECNEIECTIEKFHHNGHHYHYH